MTGAMPVVLHERRYWPPRSNFLIFGASGQTGRHSCNAKFFAHPNRQENSTGGQPEGISLRHEMRAMRNTQVVLAMVMTVFGFGGVFAAITYLSPMMTTVTGFTSTGVTWLLVLFGVEINDIPEGRAFFAIQVGHSECK